MANVPQVWLRSAAWCCLPVTPSSLPSPLLASLCLLLFSVFSSPLPQLTVEHAMRWQPAT